MTRFFIAGIAALFLSTGTAHALYPSTFLECGKTFVRIDHDKGTAPDGTRVFPRTWSIMEDAPRGARMTELGSFKFACNVKDQCWFNGKACRRMGNDEWRGSLPGEIHISPGGTLRGSLRDTFCARAAHVISPKERNGKKGRIVVVTVPKFPGSRGSPFTSELPAR